MSDLKLSENAQALLDGIKLVGDETTAMVGLKKGDVFSITGMCRFEQFDTNTFNCVGFKTSIGANTGIKHFGYVKDMPEESPMLGTTSGENAEFCAYHIEAKTKFKVMAVDVEKKTNADGQEYDSKTIKLSVI